MSQKFQELILNGNKYMEDYDKNKEWSYLRYWDVNNLFSVGECLKSFNN